MSRNPISSDFKHVHFLIYLGLIRMLLHKVCDFLLATENASVIFQSVVQQANQQGKTTQV